MICPYCQREMTDYRNVRSCNQLVEYPDGESLTPIPFKPLDSSERCGDCGVAADGWHHPGCDMETCPRCGGQLISCGCMAVESEEE